jgi:hypothetical protein
MKDQKENPGSKRQGNPRPGGPGKNRGADDQSDRSQRDQLDDQGRQRHIGHGEETRNQERRRPLDEGDENEDLGRPVRVGEDEPRPQDQGGQWDDKTEGTSRP